MFSEAISTTTEGVRVEVQTTWMQTRSNPLLGHFVFAYKVCITNESPYVVQLLRRRWIITDGFGEKRHVSGEGVIGEQPVLHPGESHEYISGCNFTTPEGQMKGHYVMLREVDGEEFKVRIPRFQMFVPYLLN